MSLRDASKTGLVKTDKNDQADKKDSLSLRKAAENSMAVSRPTGRGLEAVKKAAAAVPVSTGAGRIGFIIDATGSRSGNWKEAQDIQAGMFSNVAQFGKMAMRLVHYGGDRITDNNWMDDTADIARAMAKVECIGGSTQILPSLRKFLNDDPAQRAKSIIIVGDSFEETEAEIAPLAAQLKERGIKVFTFLDGQSFGAEKAFRQIAEQTGGVFAKFGADMPLKDLCEGVALATAGGASALQRLQNGTAKQLLLKAKF